MATSEDSASPEAVEHVLETLALTAGYGDLAAVRDLNVRVGRGEIVALFGPNGAGKTTTLLACIGLLPCMSGEVRWLGRRSDSSVHRLARAGLAYVPEGRSVTTRLSVRDNLRLGRGSVQAAIDVFAELEPLLDRPAGLLSGGEQQMLVLARALASRPRALLVDELSLGLAPLIVERLLGALRDAADRDGLAVLLVEQQAREALSVAHRWYLLRDGRLEEEGAAGGDVDRLEAAYLAGVADQRGRNGAATNHKERS
jgi:branched-chain amino acid transport system ATP-binding protein